MKNNNNNLGCSKEFNINTSSGFICGIPNGNGEERLCEECKLKLKQKWDEEDKNHKDPRIREIYKLKKEGRLNY